jgi:hypothetical protein
MVGTDQSFLSYPILSAGPSRGSGGEAHKVIGQERCEDRAVHRQPASPRIGAGLTGTYLS